MDGVEAYYQAQLLVGPFPPVWFLYFWQVAHNPYLQENRGVERRYTLIIGYIYTTGVLRVKLSWNCQDEMANYWRMTKSHKCKV